MVGHKFSAYLWPLLHALSALACLILCDVAHCASLPDEYETVQYEDNAGTTTKNILRRYSEQNPGEQSHTIHAEADVDWGICAQDAGGTTFPYSLHFSNLKLPADTYLAVSVYREGLNGVATTEHIPWFENTFDVQWLGSKTEKVVFSVGVVGRIEPAVEYTIRFARNTGP
jgi:hypothetical protein